MATILGERNKEAICRGGRGGRGGKINGLIFRKKIFIIFIKMEKKMTEQMDQEELNQLEEEEFDEDGINCYVLDHILMNMSDEQNVELVKKMPTFGME